MHPSAHAKTTPDKPAYIMAATGESVTYRELEERSNQLAHFFRDAGLKSGDAIAIFMDNNARFYEICWAAQRAGLYYTCISSRLTASEVAYIADDCNARIFFTSPAVSKVAEELLSGNHLPARIERKFAVGGSIQGYENFEETRAKFPTTPIADQTAGTDMLYSSGTTGRPKGVKHPLTGGAFDEDTALEGLAMLLYGMDANTIYLSPAPLYHAAPLRWSMTVQRLGGTVIVMEHFDAEEALRLIEKYKATHSQWVPTMFVRMLKMPEEVRAKYDVSSMKVAIHAAAPCPVPVKEQMIRWWGPVIYEYYAGSEGNGFTALNSEEWLAHKGSVGKPLNAIAHICDDEGNELPVGEAGTIYFESESQFEYHNDPKKTKEARHPNHPTWSTLGDIGRVDEEGYLYLTDRKAFMIISGGVNIYPQEAENILVMHPSVADVAVIGVPNEDFGEEVKAVVQPVDWSDAGPALEAELMEFCKNQLSAIKCPRSIDFEEELPRHPTGKLYKRLIRDRYWGNRDSKIV
ncbi:AMP-binding protein [Parvibaculum sp.]|uniref:AMP-binding protein n=1 Tax=Parvibaculum sp. TaxID=2024848 RepID=UPI001B27BA7E|nr:AMP-binding protein [Parvibaculum sp.]MBO6635193.1 AMP-binding protein [Parvibaculum sp.]MBO6678567.1 AMP-binding protein [Parvibaculum sp.]MBO6684076.1 AMP-binding protein [Parvibaculum sp.]MBO6903760.1 AMP-binding protein [Parvibaculum sp.]